MTRRGSDESSNEHDTGRKGYREPWEPVDERRVIAYGSCRCKGCREYQDPFWRDRMEQATYEAAVAGNPRRQDEGPMAYAARISVLVTSERGQPVKPMPRAGLVRI